MTLQARKNRDSESCEINLYFQVLTLCETTLGMSCAISHLFACVRATTLQVCAEYHVCRMQSVSISAQLCIQSLKIVLDQAACGGRLSLEFLSAAVAGGGHWVAHLLPRRLRVHQVTGHRG